MRRSLIVCLFAFVAGFLPGCGGAEPETPKAVVGPTTDPAGEAFSKPSKPAVPPASK